MKSLFHIFPIKSRLFPLNPVYSPALGILFDGFNTKEELKQFRPYYELHTTLQKHKNHTVQVSIDSDIIEALQIETQEYQPRINAILRKAVFG